MFRSCCIVNCASKRKDVKLFRFPKREIGLKWLQCINSEELRNLRAEDLHKRYVCQKHFEQKFIVSTNARTRLLVGAFPTLFSDSEISSGIPRPRLQTMDTDHTTRNAVSDHTYAKKRQHEDHTYCTFEPTKKHRMTKTGFDGIVNNANLVDHTTTPLVDVPSTSGCGNEASQNQIIRDAVIPSTPRLCVRRRRIILNKKSLSPQCAKLYREYLKSRKQLHFSQRARRALNFSKKNSFEKLTDKMNPLAKTIMWMQIKQCTKKSKGRRFTTEEKLIALSILKQSPKCYRFLHKIFILPTKHTLNKMVSELNIEAGISAQVFDAVKQEVNTWEENKKYCSVLFDEVALEAALTYDKKKDSITGFVELPEKMTDFADHALVFMLRGALYKWQQPIAFYFCKGATSAVQLKNIIKDVVTAVGNTGLLPIALACDQGTSFQSSLKSLLEDTRREQIRLGCSRIDDIITINGHSLSVIHDPPHLIKGLRNNFITKNIKYDNKISKWNDIVDVYKTDCNHAQMRLLHKLNDEHVIPEKIKKMKVKNCVRVFSKTVAATLSYTAQFSQYADGKPVSPTLRNTAEMVSFFDDLFDSVNGACLSSKRNKGKPLRNAVTASSQHHRFWSEAIKKLQKIKFVENKNNRETSVPSLKNWIVTLKSYQRLWQFFKSKNIRILRPRYFNSDPIENFFGQVRAYNFRNNDPNCHTFKNTFKSLLITRFIKFHSDGYNCEEDSGEQLVKLKALFEATKNNEANADSACSAGSSNLRSAVLENIPTTAIQEKLKVHSRAYTTGWVIRKILNKNNYCKQCETNLTSRETSSTSNWISGREYRNTKNLKKLTYPSENAVRTFGYIIQETNEYLEFTPHQMGIIKEIKNKIRSKYSFQFLDCVIHRDAVEECFLELSLRLAVFNWCNVINNIMKGTDVFRLENKSLPPMQNKAFIKYKTKLKNKNINK